MSWLRARCFAVAALIGALSSAAGATTIYVKSDAPGGNSGSSWNNAFTTLQAAIGFAQAGDEIWVAAGTYLSSLSNTRSESFVLTDGVAIYGGFAGTETLRTQRDFVAHTTILSGDIGLPGIATDNCYHVVRAPFGTGAAAVLDGFTITAGRADGQSDNGGGGLLSDGAPTIANCIFTANYAVQGAAALTEFNPPSAPTFTNCTFRSNEAVSGSAVNNNNFNLVTSFESCIFDRNVTDSTNAAAAYSGAAASFDNCRFSNHASGAFVIGVFNSTLNRCTFRNNSASLAALSINGGSMTNCVFDGNHGATPVITGSTTIDHITATNNSGPAVLSGTFAVTNSILWGNAAPMIGPGSSVTFSYCDLQSSVAGGNITADPQFVNSSDPGDIHLGPSSPCIDAGDNTAVPPGITTDIDGGSRFVDDVNIGDTGNGIPPISDIGADEFTTAPAGFNLSVATTGPGAGTIVVTPPGASCVDACSYNYATGTVVTITATADAAGTFAGWSGACSGSGGCAVTMNAARSVSARFAPLRFVNPAAGGGNTGTTWSNAFTSLASAIGSAPRGSEIWVIAGAYTPGSTNTSTFTLNGGTQIYGGFTGLETSRAQRNPATHKTVLTCEIGTNAAEDNCQHVVTVDASGDGATLVDGFTISGAYANGVGGAIYVPQSGALTVGNCILRGNEGVQTGGTAVYVDQNAAGFTMLNSVVTANGGYSAIQSAAPITIVNCTIARNALSPLVLLGQTPSSIINTILWSDVFTGLGNVSLSHCIARGYGPGQTLFNDPDPHFAGGNDLRLADGSPAIDAGDNTAVPASIQSDLSGLPRFVNDPLKADTGVGPAPVVDIGAYEFARDALVVTKIEAADGTVQSTDGGVAIDCGPTCIAHAAPGTTFTLNATASGFTRFTGWGGACSGVGSCTVTVPASVTARFGRVRYVKSDATGANNGTSFANAFTDLQPAIASTLPGDDIWVASATYKPTSTTDTGAAFRLRSDVGLYGGFAGNEVFRTQRDPAAHITTLSGDIGTPGNAGDNSQSVVVMSSITESVLDGFTISGGNGQGGNGAGINLFAAGAAIANCTISGNSVSGFGLGGGLYINSASPSISNSTFSGNTANSGGAVGVDSYSAPQFTDCALTANTAVQSAGIWANSSTLTLTRCLIADNTASYVGGSAAGVFVYPVPNLPRPLIDHCTFRGNTTPGPASAIEGAGIELRDSMIINNTSSASHGFALRFFGDPSLIVNTTIAGNTAGAAAVSIDSSSPATITNTIVAGNNTPASFAGDNGPVAVTYSDIANGGTPYPGAGNIDADPQFRDFASGDFHLTAGSPCIDAGDNSAVGSTTTDIFGKPRRLDYPATPDTGAGTAPIVDIGADEGYPITLTGPDSVNVCTGSDTTLLVVADGYGSLAYQWQKNASAVAGANAPSFAIHSAQSGDDADYAVTVSDAYATSVQSPSVHVGVATTATIDTQPSGAAICAGDPLNLSVAVSGGYVSYQWRIGGNPISGATSPTLNISSAGANDAGNYDVLVSNACTASFASAMATVTVSGVPPVVTTNPVDKTYTEGATVVFTAAASGTPSPAVQWQRSPDGVTFTPIAGATSPTLSFPASVADNGARYRAVFTSTCVTSATTTAATLTIRQFTNPVLTARVTPIRATHIIELRSHIDEQRARYSLGTFPWTDADPTGHPVRAIHIEEMRTALNAAYIAAGKPLPNYHQQNLHPIPGCNVPDTCPGFTLAIDIAELRAAVVALE